MSRVPYESLTHAVGDKAMAVGAWVLRLFGVPAVKAAPAPAEVPWRRNTTAAQLAMDPANEPEERATSVYCGLHGYTCHCNEPDGDEAA